MIMCNLTGKNTFKEFQQDDGETDEFKGMEFPHSQNVSEIFKQIFGLKTFRHNQLQAINAALLNYDCFILMPTGGGKSLCYQLPALITSGVTVVIAPLRSLVHDQVQKLHSMDIPATFLLGDMTADQLNEIYLLLSMSEPAIKLLYCTPEKIIMSERFVGVLDNLYSRNLIARFVIDEAHCVSQWGHDFRPDYKKLSCLRRKFPRVPLMMLTATATFRVRKDILHQLEITSPKWFVQSFNRPTLTYKVIPKKGKSVICQIAELIIDTGLKDQSGIIYCLSRNECENVALNLYKEGLAAGAYHAGLESRDRVKLQEDWINDKYKIICATIAFGMGIDKPDVRFVIHYSLPKSLEGYYQESGRAGRDGENAICVLFYSYQDSIRLKRMIQSEANSNYKHIHLENLNHVVQFCENKTDCRRSQILDYFGENFDSEDCKANPKTVCDNCAQQGVYMLTNVTDEAKAIIQCVATLSNRRNVNVTITQLVDIFKGSSNNKIMTEGYQTLPLYGTGTSYNRNDAERLTRKLVLDGYLFEKLQVSSYDHVVSYVRTGSKYREIFNQNFKIEMALSKKIDKIGLKKRIKESVILDPKKNNQLEIQNSCFKELLELCKTIGKEVRTSYINILSSDAIREMSRMLPITIEELKQITGMGAGKLVKFGQRFLTITTKYAEELKVYEQSVQRANIEKSTSSSVIGNGSRKNNSNVSISPYFLPIDLRKGKNGSSFNKRRSTIQSNENTDTYNMVPTPRYTSSNKMNVTPASIIRNKKTKLNTFETIVDNHNDVFENGTLREEENINPTVSTKGWRNKNYRKNTISKYGRKAFNSKNHNKVYKYKRKFGAKASSTKIKRPPPPYITTDKKRPQKSTTSSFLLPIPKF